MDRKNLYSFLEYIRFKAIFQESIFEEQDNNIYTDTKGIKENMKDSTKEVVDEMINAIKMVYLMAMYEEGHWVEELKELQDRAKKIK